MTVNSIQIMEIEDDFRNITRSNKKSKIFTKYHALVNCLKVITAGVSQKLYPYCPAVQRLVYQASVSPAANLRWCGSGWESVKSVNFHLI